MNVESYNPTTGEIQTTGFAETSREDVTRLCEMASRAARTVASYPLSWRAALLDSMADALETDASNIVALADAETGLGDGRLNGELKRTCFQLRFFADVVRDGGFLEASIDHACDSPMGPLPDLRRQLEPLGVIGVFGASNFPLAFSVPGGDTASALAAGCSVVIKAHPAHPRTSFATFVALERAAREMGAPEGTLALVFGLEAGVSLVEDPHVVAVGFTGSYAAGRALFDRAQSRAVPIPFYGELGSANPLVVSRGAARERAQQLGEGLVASVTVGSGQFCTKPGLLFVPSGEDGDALMAAAQTALQAGNGATMLGRAIRERFETGVSLLGGLAGVTELARSGSSNADAGSFAAMFTCDVPTLVSNREALMNEYFGAVAIIVRYGSLDELLSAVEHLEPALTFTLHVGEDDPDAPALLAQGTYKAGRVIVNGFPTGVSVSWSMHHGGPHPAATSSMHTSVGATAIRRWLRPMSYQGVPDRWLPETVRDDNPLGIPQRVDGKLRIFQE